MIWGFVRSASLFTSILRMVSLSLFMGLAVFIGSGVTIVPGIEIADNARIGAGSVVIANVGKGETVFGNPAAKV